MPKRTIKGGVQAPLKDLTPELIQQYCTSIKEYVVSSAVAGDDKQVLAAMLAILTKKRPGQTTKQISDAIKEELIALEEDPDLDPGDMSEQMMASVIRGENAPDQSKHVELEKSAKRKAVIEPNTAMIHQVKAKLAADQQDLVAIFDFILKLPSQIRDQIDALKQSPQSYGMKSPLMTLFAAMDHLIKQFDQKYSQIPGFSKALILNQLNVLRNDLFSQTPHQFQLDYKLEKGLNEVLHGEPHVWFSIDQVTAEEAKALNKQLVVFLQQNPNLESFQQRDIHLFISLLKITDSGKAGDASTLFAQSLALLSEKKPKPVIHGKKGTREKNTASDFAAGILSTFKGKRPK